MRNLILFSILIFLFSCQSNDKKSNSSTIQQNNQIAEIKRIDSLHYSDNKEYKSIDGWEKCCELHSNEKKKFALENFKDSYVKTIMRYYYSFEEDTVKQPNNIAEYYAKVEKPSLLYFKINSNSIKDLELTLTGKPFKKEKHSITISNSEKCCLIDNKVYWGTDGSLPKEQFDRFEIKINGKEIVIPKTEYDDLFEPLWCGGSEHKGKIITTNNGVYIIFILNGSDGAGSYMASFVFKNKVYIGRIIEEFC
jgi:hypothetical protein